MNQIDRSNFQKFAKRSCVDLNGDIHFKHMQFGIITKTANIFDIFRKKLTLDKEIDLNSIELELGDLCWYVSNGMSRLDMNLEDHCILIDEEHSIDELLILILQESVYLSTFLYSIPEIAESTYKERYKKIIKYVYKICYLTDIDFDKMLSLNSSILESSLDSLYKINNIN